MDFNHIHLKITKLCKIELFEITLSFLGHPFVPKGTARGKTQVIFDLTKKK